jgi:hypothetical protein
MSLGSDWFWAVEAIRKLWERLRWSKAKELFHPYYIIATFKDLQKLVQSQDPEQHSHNYEDWDKPFWIRDPKQHKLEDIRSKGDCCFNHIIGLPRKDGRETWNTGPITKIKSGQALFTSFCKPCAEMVGDIVEAIASRREQKDNEE